MIRSIITYIIGRSSSSSRYHQHVSGNSGIINGSSYGGTNGSTSSRVFHCTSERITIVLIVIIIVWIGGIATILSGGGPGSSLPHPSIHSHQLDMNPRGRPSPIDQSSSSSFSLIELPSSDSGDDILMIRPPDIDTTDGDDTAVVPTPPPPSPPSRLFGLTRLDDMIRQELKYELHHIFEHDNASPQHTEPTTATRSGERGRKTVTDLDAKTDVVPVVAIVAPLVAPSTTAAAVVVATTAAPTPIVAGAMRSPAIIVLTYKRRAYLQRTLDSLLAQSGVSAFDVYVSQDGSMMDLSDLPSLYANRQALKMLIHPRHPLMASDQGATAYLAQHYKWALDMLFITNNHSHVIVMEDDMLVSPDFLSLFTETSSLLDSDPTLFCVSSWNDNGMRAIAADPKRLMRTDYFPGLGWMTNRAVWTELSAVFPLDQWDHFMRLDTTHRGRDCIIPEVTRNRNIGEEGTNMGQNFFARYLEPMSFNQVAVSFVRTLPSSSSPAASAGKGVGDLEYMRSTNFEASLQSQVAAAKMLGSIGDAPAINAMQSMMGVPPSVPEIEDNWLITYERSQFRYISQLLGLLSVPRAIHQGLSSVRMGPHIVFFADIRICPYLPPSHRLTRDPSVLTVVADQNVDCDSACARVGFRPVDGNGGDGTGGGTHRCESGHFQYINQCSELKQHFACDKGCRGGVSGPDVPNYVDNPSKPELYGYCLTTEDTPQCEAKHWSASRLCPCKKK